jgi:hypothetical protein
MLGRTLGSMREEQFELRTSRVRLESNRRFPKRGASRVVTTKIETWRSLATDRESVHDGSAESVAQQREKGS